MTSAGMAKRVASNSCEPHWPSPQYLPILDDDVERDVARCGSRTPRPEGGRGRVPLAALEQAERPARHERGGARHAPVAGDDPIELGSEQEVVVDAVSHLRPERRRRRRARRGLPRKRERIHGAVGGPLQAHGHGFARGQLHAHHLFVRQPALTPVVGLELAADGELQVAGRERLEEVIAADGRRDVHGDIDAAGRGPGHEATRVVAHSGTGSYSRRSPKRVYEVLSQNTP